MAGGYFEDQQFDAIDFSDKPLLPGVYEGCGFTNCNLSEGDLSGMQFIDCVFINCNLSMIKTIDTSLNGVRFEGCKMLGINFETCNRSLFKPSFQRCVLNYSSFYQCSLKKARLPGCIFHGTDFTETDLTEAVFTDCDLRDAKFERTILEKADLRTALSYSINPELNRIRKAKFSYPAVTGLLDKYDIEIS